MYLFDKKVYMKYLNGILENNCSAMPSLLENKNL